MGLEAIKSGRFCF